MTENVNIDDAIKMLCDQLDSNPDMFEDYNSQTAAIVLSIVREQKSDILTDEEAQVVRTAYRDHTRRRFTEKVVKSILDKDFKRDDGYAMKTSPGSAIIGNSMSGLMGTALGSGAATATNIPLSNSSYNPYQNQMQNVANQQSYAQLAQQKAMYEQEEYEARKAHAAQQSPVWAAIKKVLP